MFFCKAIELLKFLLLMLIETDLFFFMSGAYLLMKHSADFFVA